MYQPLIFCIAKWSKDDGSEQIEWPLLGVGVETETAPSGPNYYRLSNKTAFRQWTKFGV